MWPKISLVLAVASLCSGCAYDVNDRYAQSSQPYGYAPYGYVPHYSYGSPPSYYQPAPSPGFGYFGGLGHRDYYRHKWPSHHEGGRQYHGGGPRVGQTAPPPAAHAPTARSAPGPAANASALDRLGFRANP